MPLPFPAALLKTLISVANGHATSAEIHRHDSDRKHIQIIAINRRLERLRAKGLVRRAIDPGLGRYFRYALTAEGRKQLRQMARPTKGKHHVRDHRSI